MQEERMNFKFAVLVNDFSKYSPATRVFASSLSRGYMEHAERIKVGSCLTDEEVTYGVFVALESAIKRKRSGVIETIVEKYKIKQDVIERMRSLIELKPLIRE